MDGTLIILAGGESHRMGVDKAFMVLDGKPLVAHVINRLAPAFEHVVISCREAGPYAAFGLPVITDKGPGGGALLGIYTALSEIKDDRALVVACDILKQEFACFILEGLGDYGACVPRTEKGFEPLFAAYGREALPAIGELLGRGERRISKIFKMVPTRIIEEGEWRVFDPEGLSFLNANTPAEFAVIEKRYGRENANA